jgi:site-specific recombinase XerD
MSDDVVVNSSKEVLEGLVSDALEHLRQLGYNPRTLANYRRTLRRFLHFVQEEARAQTLSTDLVERFLKSCGIEPKKQAPQLSFEQRRTKNVMRVLTEFGLHGCFQCRGGTTERIKLPRSLEATLSGYETFCREYLRSSSQSVRSRKRDTLRFLHFLTSQGLTSVKQIQVAMLSEFLKSRVHLKTASLARVASSLRCFLRYLSMRGLVPDSLVSQLPRVRNGRDQRIPSVWSQRQVAALLAAVDRSSPCGKRDYAILLLAARLGMRASDIRGLCLDHLLWDQARIEMSQTKGGGRLSLPLTEEVGAALIDYLRHGRPPTHYREVFLRVNAPFQPFAGDNNLHYIITTYRQRAGIALPAQSRRGLHSLRHSVASRLLETGTSLETISSILGHLSTESTRIYTKVDIEALRSAALDPEEVAHA